MSTNHTVAGQIARAIMSHLGALFTPYTLLMFVLGLWLGYRGAVDQYRACRHARYAHSIAANCPVWAITDD